MLNMEDFFFPLKCKFTHQSNFKYSNQLSKFYIVILNQPSEWMIVSHPSPSGSWWTDTTNYYIKSLTM